MMRTALGARWLAAAVLLSGCGDEARSVGPVQATVGEEGGVVELPGGGTLEVPAGAVDEGTQITVDPIDAPASGLLTPAGDYYLFGPEGLEFYKSATVTMPFELPDGVTDASLVWVSWYTEEEGWRFLPSTVDADAGTVSAKVTHFCIGGPAIPKKLPDVCCVTTGAQPAAELVPPDECAGEALKDVGECGDVCCERVQDGKPARLMEARALCSRNKGKEAPADSCMEVCCLAWPDYAWALLTTPGDCTDRAGVMADALEQCDEVCCDVGGTAKAVSRARCVYEGGTETDVGQCGGEPG